MILKDASLSRRRIPLSHCRHFEMLEAFLEVHYEGKPGDMLAQQGQCKLTTGSRRGPAIPKRSWLLTVSSGNALALCFSCIPSQIEPSVRYVTQPWMCPSLEGWFAYPANGFLETVVICIMYFLRHVVSSMVGSSSYVVRACF